MSTTTGTATYLVDIPGLMAVATAPPNDKHSALLTTLRRHAGPVDLGAAKITAVRGDSWLGRRKVLNAAGEVIHDNHEAWLNKEVERDGGSVTAAWQRLTPLDYRLSRCALTTLYVVVDRGGARADDFLRLEIASR
jgi:hypothetical protein